MEQGKEHIDDLIARYASQTISSAELAELLQWAKGSEQNKAYFKQQVALLRQIGAQNISFDSAKAHSELLKSVNRPRAKVRKLSSVWLAAASVVLAAIMGGMTYWISNRPEPAMVQLTSNSAAAVYVLDDSSEVTLSRNSLIAKSQVFGKLVREVNLTGRAFFKVSHDASRPFVVKVGNICIKVLGTQFEVAEAADSTVTVTVASGKVAVGYLSDKPVILTRNQQVEISQQGKILDQTEIANDNYLAWKTRVVIFDSTPMSKVAEQLSDIYGKHFAVESNEVGDKLFTSKIDNQSLSDVKFILSNALDVDLVERGDSIIIRERP